MASFTPEQQDKLLQTMKEIIHSKFVDPSNPPTTREQIDNILNRRGGKKLDFYKPDAFNFNKPEVWCREIWHQYVSFAALDDQPTSRRGTKRTNTTKERTAPAKQLAKYLGRTPTAADLKAAFPTLTQLDDELCKAIDQDLESLLHR